MSIFQIALQHVMDNWEENKAEDDYIGEDGFLHCGVCGEPKEAPMPEEILVMFPERKTRPRMCKCMIEKADREEKEAVENRKRMRIENLRKFGLYDPLYEMSRFENDDGRQERAIGIAKKYVANFSKFYEENIGLMFWGGVGTGKSFIAACIANALIDKLTPVIMSSVQDLVSDITEDYGANRDYILSHIKNVDLLILDDLGVERDTPYMLEHVYDIVNARYKAKKPLIVTTNLSMAQMSGETDFSKKRIYDRVIEMCQGVKVDGDSRRRTMAKTKADIAKRLLGLGDDNASNH